MKTAIKTIIATALSFAILTGTGASLFAAEKAKATTTLTGVKNISKIVASGNVDLILIQADQESVKVYDNYYSKNALIQQQDGTLRISSFDKEKLTVVAYVKNISSVELNDQTTARTVGKFMLLNLDLTLKNNASALINANTIALNTNLSGEASLKLTGETGDYNAVISSTAQLDMDQFKAETSHVSAKNERETKVIANSANGLSELALGNEVALLRLK